MNHDEPRTIHTIATSGADAVARWRASKQQKRSAAYQRRMQPKSDKLAHIPAWLSAVDRDRDPVEKLTKVDAFEVGYGS